jgi:hypothetical protein
MYRNAARILFRGKGPMQGKPIDDQRGNSNPDAHVDLRPNRYPVVFDTTGTATLPAARSFRTFS